jgi:phospholipid/cholesterol/gamma-HCH transport system substrate-binding protein
MPRRTRWKELIIGIISLAAVLGVGAAILVFARVGMMHGDAFRLYAQAGAARGVIRGTEVWLSGQRVGTVKDVSFLPPSFDTTSRVLITMDVLEGVRSQIRENSNIQIRAGGSLIGAPIVDVAIGTPSTPAVTDGDTLRALPQSDFENVASEFALASKDFPVIIANLKLLNIQLHGVQGTLGALGIEKGGRELTIARERVGRLGSDLTTPHGTVGLALNASSPLAARAQRVMARADSVRTLLASDRSVLGRFRRDSSLLREVADIRNEVDILRARMADPHGTLGRAGADSAVFLALANAQQNLTRSKTSLRSLRTSNGIRSVISISDSFVSSSLLTLSLATDSFA